MTLQEKVVAMPTRNQELEAIARNGWASLESLVKKLGGHDSDIYDVEAVVNNIIQAEKSRVV